MRESHVVLACPHPTSARPVDRARLTSLVAIALFTLVLGAACGGSTSPAIVFDSVPPTTSTTASLTSDPLGAGSTQPPQLGPWVDATSNLAGMPSECGNLTYVAANPGRDQVLAGVALQGLWVNNGGNGEWTRLGTGGAQVRNRPASIVFDPDSPDRFWESGHYNGVGAFRTTDGGQTFQPLADITHLDGISVDLSDPNRRTLLAGAHERADLYRSTDGGASWTNIGPNLPTGVGFASQPLVLDGQRHLLGTSNAAGAGIFLTTDGGAAWQQVAAGAVGGLPLVTHDGSIYWPLQSGGLARSTDGGATWTVATGAGVIASYNVVELADGTLASLGSTRIIVSDDQGVTWRALGPELPMNRPYGLTYSEPRNAIYIWQWDCGDQVLPGAIQRLDLSPAPT